MIFSLMSMLVLVAAILVLAGNQEESNKDNKVSQMVQKNILLQKIT
jgi:hypothetical protein